MTTRPSQPPSRRRPTGELLLRGRPAADRPATARTPLESDSRRPPASASLLLSLAEPLPSDYYLG